MMTMEMTEANCVERDLFFGQEAAVHHCDSRIIKENLKLGEARSKNTKGKGNVVAFAQSVNFG